MIILADVFYRSMSLDRTVVTFEAKPVRLATIKGNEKKVQAFKVYIDGVTKLSHFMETEKIETYFLPKEDIPTDWQGGMDLRNEFEIRSRDLFLKDEM